MRPRMSISNAPLTDTPAQSQDSCFDAVRIRSATGFVDSRHLLELGLCHLPRPLDNP